MGGRPQKREKASGRKGLGTGFHVEREMDSRWNWGSLFTLGRCPRFTLSPLSSFYVGTGLRGYRFTVEAGDAVTLRGC